MIFAVIILALALAVTLFVLFRKTSQLASVRANLAASDARLASEAEHSRDTLEQLKQVHEEQIRRERESLNDRFSALASDILRANSEQLDRNSRTSLETLLAPMKADLENFTKNFRECYDFESRDRLSLREEVQRLATASRNVEQEAARLSTALRGSNSAQGRWGEMILANILEQSGLEQGRWFVTQETTTDADGRIRPDAVIHCPDNRDVIIDSKVSLTSYLAMLEADNDTRRSEALRAHVSSVENHIRTLGSKEYQKRIGSRNGDFVFLFMPHEGAYIAAMNSKRDLWKLALENNVILISPTHLITAVRLVEQMWRAEDQSQHTRRVVELGTMLANSIGSFLQDIDGVYSALDNARDTFESAVHRFHEGRGNLVSVSQRLSELGIRSTKKNARIPDRFALDDENPAEEQNPGQGHGRREGE
ncbi:MAG: DNA recombination protein RmuC [Muribaculaceae bacterium]|nr:DNA recombination protein RmuC [Muribaculaceae bacterium]